MIRNGRLVPRPGLQKATDGPEDAFSLDTVVGLFPAKISLGGDTNPTLDVLWAFSRDTIARSRAGGSSWTHSVGPSFTASSQFISFNDVEWVDTTQVWSSTGTTFHGSAVGEEVELFVFTGGDFDNANANVPMLSEMTGSNQNPSHFTHQSFVSSGESNARAVEAYDDRLIFFNTLSSDGSYHPNRLRWSVRGDPLDFVGIGAGFEDLHDMLGEGVAAVENPTSGRLVLFSSKEIWVATPRRDDFSFDFEALERTVGCSRRKTIVPTPLGIVFVGEDDYIYLIAQGQALRISRRFQAWLRDSDHVQDPGDLFSVYNPKNRSYMMFYQSQSGLGNDADRVLELYLDDIDQTFETPATSWFWGENRPVQAATYDQDNYPWFISSDGTVFRITDNTNTDIPSRITCKIRTRPLSASRNRIQHEAPTEAWLDYRSEASSIVSAFYSTDQGASFTAAGTGSATTASNHSQVFIPMTVQAARHPMLEFRFVSRNPGGIGDLPGPEIGPIQITLRSYTGRFSG